MPNDPSKSLASQQKQENQIKAVRSFVAQGVDAIFIAPVVATGWEPVLKEAKDAEIPVFLLDRSIDVKDKSLYMTTVTADNILEGKLIGDWLVKEVNGKPCNGCGSNCFVVRHITRCLRE